MKKKINLQFIMMMALAIIATSVLCIIVFYEIFKREMFENLKTYAYLLEDTCDMDQTFPLTGQKEQRDVRVTLIDAAGFVVYDTDAQTDDMNNHSDRPEIEAAMKNGFGTAMRRSDTMNQNTFYYALLLENGNILRVAREADSLWGIFKNALPVIGVIAALILAGCMAVSHFLTKSLIRPIELVANNMDHLENVTVYREMQPFVSTIQKQHEAILQSAMMRQEFTANVSHELKTPLTSISGYSELIENGMAKDQDVIRFAGEIHHSANRLLALINDILKLSELDTGVNMLDFAEFDLYETVKDCVEMLRLHAMEHRVALHLTGSRTMLRADKDLIDEVVYNLCDNAIRYNHEGGNVWIEVSAQGGKPYLIVRDDGIGISQENQKRIFERFYRVDKSRSKKTGGTGLGLAIVKHIIEQHHATIAVESEEGIGTTIKVLF